MGGSGRNANRGFDAKLWQTADARRNDMDAAEFKQVVLGLIFLANPFPKAEVAWTREPMYARRAAPVALTRDGE